ncbi:hypothetical protein [Nostoc sp. ChiSLP03a]|uniref:hypothetical protein n=1 Tax=Nostoc sp. ChiSLP03a TaxID=3075380 RepID=UPI002AD2CE58|nr:hypothetical protein [Nostoc sp. ChiSLP03a]MDZ8210822.1 hypothetical protein [Nostoc sp. ChiSLP03a]
MHKVHSESAIALTPKFSRKSDRSYQVLLQISDVYDGLRQRTNKSYENLNF